MENDGNRKMTEGGSNDSTDDDAAGCDGKTKFGCEGEMDNGDENDDVGNDGGVDIDNDNDANGGDGMSKTDRNDNADGGGSNINYGGSVDGNVVFDTKICDEAHGDEQIKNVAGDLAEFNGSYKVETIVGVM